MHKSLLMKSPLFLKIWLANLFSNFSTIFCEVAIIWYVVATTHSALQVGGVSLALLLGGTLGSALVGQVVDRFPTRDLMVKLGVFHLLILALFTIFTLFNGNHLLAFYLVSFFFAAINAAYGVARSKSVPEVVGDEKIAEANGLESVSASLVRIAAWGLGGAVISLFALEISLIIAITGLGISLWLISQSAWESKINASNAEKSGSVFEGWKIIKSHSNIGKVIASETFFYPLMGFLWVAFPIRVAEIGDGFLYGLHGVAFGIGYLITSLLLAVKLKSRDFRKKAWKFYVIGFLVYAIGNFFLTFTFSPWIFLLGLFISGLGTTYWSTFKMTIFHTTIETAQIGKVFSIFETLMTAIQIPGFLLGGLLVDRFGTGPVMGMVTILQVISIGMLVWPTRQFKFRSRKALPPLNH